MHTYPHIPFSPIAMLDRTKDNTYLVLVESADGHSYIDKAYFADDEQKWFEGALPRDPYIGLVNVEIERGPWKVTAFALWPTPEQAIVHHYSDCPTGDGPAYPVGKCDCDQPRMPRP